MMIQVNYTDNRNDYVKDFTLEALISSGAISRFRRCSGWVQVGVDPVRKDRLGTQYDGAERRLARASGPAA